MTKKKPYEIVRSALNGAKGAISDEEIRYAVAILKERLEVAKASYEGLEGLEEIELSDYVENLLKGTRKRRSKELMKKAATLF